MVGLGMYLYKGSMVMYKATWSLVTWSLVEARCAEQREAAGQVGGWPSTG